MYEKKNKLKKNNCRRFYSILAHLNKLKGKLVLISHSISGQIISDKL